MRSLRVQIIAAVALLLTVDACATVQPTPPPATAPADIVKLSGAAVMIGTGDIARCDSRGPEATADLVDSVLRADTAAKIEKAVITLGDNAYTSGTVMQFANCFAPTWGDSANKLIMKYIRPSPGNHEYHTSGADPYYKYFGKAAGDPAKGYYSYDIGEWHAVALNSEIIVNSGFTNAQRKAQEDWLREDLKNNAKDCTVAYWHHPRFSSGTHGNDPALRPVWNILDENKADLILVGHDHNYERFVPQTADGVADTVRGIAQIVVGTGGATLRTVASTPVRNSAFVIAGRFGVLMLTLGAKEYRSAFLEVGGRVWDHSGGKCH